MRPLLRAHALNAVLLGVVPIAIVVLWWTQSANSTSPFFPPLSQILTRFKEMWLFDLVASDVLPSLSRMLRGFVIGVVVGVALGVALGRVALVRHMLSPFVHLGRAMPATALVPVAITLLGVGDSMKVALIAFVCVFPILLNTMDAVASVDSGLEEVARSYRLTPFQRLTSILLPSAAPQIFSGARISLGIALIMMIVSEMLAATNGIGYVTLQAQQTFRIRDMWAGMLLLGVLGTVLNVLFVRIERRVIRWKPLTQEF